MNPRSGMTLVEVLAALVLLTLIATTALPVLRSAFGTLRSAPPGQELAELGELADAFLEDPAAFGFPGALPDEGVLVRTDVPGRQLASFRVLASNDVEHVWVAVQAQGVAVFRWHQEAR